MLLSVFMHNYHLWFLLFVSGLLVSEIKSASVSNNDKHHTESDVTRGDVTRPDVTGNERSIPEAQKDYQNGDGSGLLTQTTAQAAFHDGLYAPITEPPPPLHRSPYEDENPIPLDQSFVHRMENLLPVHEAAPQSLVQQIEDAPPRPYNFGYVARDPHDGSSHSRSESGDSTGRVVGYYTLRSPEGHTRRVNYIADERGFRAEVITNEPGTANQSPANVIVRSSAVQPFPNRYTPPGAGGGGASAASAAAASYNLPSTAIFVDPKKRVVRVPRGYRAVFVPVDY